MRKLFIFVFIFFCASNAFADFSQFVRITPETQEKYKEDITISIIEEMEGMFAVTVSTRINTWFIAFGEGLPEEDQNFRDLVWDDKDIGREVLNKQIVYDAKMEVVEKKDTIELLIDTELMKRSYIYQDEASDRVLDGGFYFTVDLATFLPEKMN